MRLVAGVGSCGRPQIEQKILQHQVEIEVAVSGSLNGVQFFEGGEQSLRLNATDGVQLAPRIRAHQELRVGSDFFQEQIAKTASQPWQRLCGPVGPGELLGHRECLAWRLQRAGEQ